MKVYDIKSDMPNVSDAGKRLASAIKEAKTNKEKVIKILHGYGSHGVGGSIKIAVRKSLSKKIKTNEIKAYIPGEAFASLMGFDEVIREYKDLIKNDSDYNKMNDGITYVIL
ncbi:MAG: Smr/MutS family protein [Acholeplasma sp.]|jgi:hypothetical protein|nr:Smr/MutS family protein [Acholeplasma sp.]